MDIQKEREAFEAWFESRYDANFMQFALDLGFYVDKHTQTCWEAWQAAKAQAVPEGYVLMPKEPTPKMIDATWDFDDEIREMSHNTRNEFIYKTMIEAQEPANDQGRS